MCRRDVRRRCRCCVRCRRGGAGTGRDRRVQRRHHPRHLGPAHERGRFHLGARRQPHRRVPGCQTSRQIDDAPALRANRVHLLRRGAGGPGRPGQLRRLQGGPAGHGPIARPGVRVTQHHRERRGPGPDRHRHDRCRSATRERTAIAEAVPLGRFGTAEEVADAVAFLASERAATSPASWFPSMAA